MAVTLEAPPSPAPVPLPRPAAGAHNDGPATVCPGCGQVEPAGTLAAHIVSGHVLGPLLGNVLGGLL